MTNMHRDVNERLELQTTNNLVSEFRPELAAFLRRLSLAHLLDEVFGPLVETTRTKAAVAFEQRPWPPAGVGARSLSGFGIAVVSDDGQALLTPVMMSAHHQTNVGLATALTKMLFEDLIDEGVESVAFFVNVLSTVVSGELDRAGFEPRAARLLSDGAEFVAFAASPRKVLDALGVQDARVGDVLALNLERSQVSQLAAFHFSLTAGVSNHWGERTQWADVFPGLIDWVALPPGGITGTSGPGGEEGVDPVVVLSAT